MTSVAPYLAEKIARGEPVPNPNPIERMLEMTPEELAKHLAEVRDQNTPIK